MSCVLMLLLFSVCSPAAWMHRLVYSTVRVHLGAYAVSRTITTITASCYWKGENSIEFVLGSKTEEAAPRKNLPLIKLPITGNEATGIAGKRQCTGTHCPYILQNLVYRQGQGGKEESTEFVMFLMYVSSWCDPICRPLPPSPSPSFRPDWTVGTISKKQKIRHRQNTTLQAKRLLRYTLRKEKKEKKKQNSYAFKRRREV